MWCWKKLLFNKFVSAIYNLGNLNMDQYLPYIYSKFQQSDVPQVGNVCYDTYKSRINVNIVNLFYSYWIIIMFDILSIYNFSMY